MDEERTDSHQATDSNISPWILRREFANTGEGFVEEKQESHCDQPRTYEARFRSQLKKVVLRMSYDPFDVKRPVSGENLCESAEAGAQERKVLDDLKGIGPKLPSVLKALLNGKETADHCVEADQCPPEQGQTKNEYWSL